MKTIKSRISPIQQERKPIEVPRTNSDKFQSFKGLFGSFEDQGTKIVKGEKFVCKEKMDIETTRTNAVISKLVLYYILDGGNAGTEVANTSNI
ncbi:hypothetical protein Tco_1273887 [Tanacetum coccineum]